MKKIKKIRLNEAMFTLSPEEMRHIGGGDTVTRCITGKCRVYINYYEGLVPVELAGECTRHMNACYCFADGDYFGEDNINKNGCMVGSPI